MNHYCTHCFQPSEYHRGLCEKGDRHFPPLCCRQCCCGSFEIAHPEIVCLCGSTRFYDAFQQANYDLTMQGKIILSVGFYPHATAEAGHGEGVGHDSAQKVKLDELHKRKIDLADRVFVLNVGDYVGESTRSEIEYARAHGKTIEYLEPRRVHYPFGWNLPVANPDAEETE